MADRDHKSREVEANDLEEEVRLRDANRANQTTNRVTEVGDRAEGDVRKEREYFGGYGY